MAMKERTKSLAIPKEIKQRVAERDSCERWPCCILCGRPAPTSAPLAYSCAHYISRAQGGLGIEENTLTLCPRCHQEYDTTEREKLRPFLKRYLQEHYENWSEEKLIYQKEKEI